MTFAIGISMAIICSVIGDLLMKQGSQQINVQSIESFGGIWGLLNPLQLFKFIQQSGIFHNWKLILGVVILSGHFAGYLIAMRTAPVVTVVPLMASTYIIDSLLAKIVLHERITWVRWLGVGVVVAGVTSLVGVSGISDK